MDPFRFPPLPSSQFNDSPEWSYSMRRDMQEIIPGLYLGPYAAAVKSKLCYLQNFGITHIICIRQSCEANFIKPNFPDVFKYLVLDIADSQTENIIRFFPKVRDFLNNCFLTGGKALVHGNAGISRSAALIIAYVMEKHGLSYRETYSYVQERRFCINPNEGFAQQLQEYEPIYRANLTLEYGHPSIETGRLKRKLDEDDDGSSEMMIS
ncbi:serine/threonine/tyrosine-interacting protein A-like [Tubulanus polymorphus]|uniref:serine/threonine/tyrosine-interacting protein A-like n=1 Tax=Tubulanus polymorphus TaxID=672921 RepID=UPI003DA494F9